jgi:Ca-activated chloride channel family protein
VIKQYRLIGFDNKRDVIADTTGDLNGGEIGSGNNVMAIFEVVPAIPNALDAAIVAGDTIARVALNYNANNSKIRNEINFNCFNNYQQFSALDKDYQMATAIAMFGMKLRQSKYLLNGDWADIEAIASKAYDPANYLQSEFLRLVTVAKKVYPKRKKLKWL